ncbi:MAG: hypothetical protein II804_08800 [Clostridia bacterium]|nr:hypothetical protein [Clostridia bacterium]
MKKTIAWILCVLLALTLAVPAFAAEKQGTDVPTVYLQGQGEHIYLPDGTKIYDGGDLPDGFLADAVKECMPSFLDAVRNDDAESWAAYREKLLGMLLPVIGGWALNKDGEASDGSHIDMSWWNQGPGKFGDGSYRFRTYNFYQDWRVDPFETARLLNTFIQKVKSETGAPKVNLVGRCEGANVILAYLAEYGYDDVNCVEIYVQSASGVDGMSALFSGRMQLDATALRRFKETSDLIRIEDQALVELIDAALEFTGDTMLLDAGMLGLQALIPKVYKEVVVYALRETYGRMPGIWSLVGADYYQDARKGVFKGYEDEYAKLLEKLDNYDVKVRQRVEDIILDAVAHGVKFANYSKYGNYQVTPICETNNEIGDNSVSLKFESMGATTAKFGDTLSDSYLEKAKKNGTDQYISPDKMVDASTCLLPDTTWFIYGSDHRDFPELIHAFMFKFLKADGNLKVNDDSAPQFMVYAGSETDHTDTLVPMEEENAATLESGNVVFKNINWKDMVMRFFKSILNFFKSFLLKRIAA